MEDPALNDPRIRQLLDEARKARSLRERLTADGGDAAEVDEALDGLLRDLGRALLAWADLHAPVRPELEPISASAGELPESDDDGSWYTSELPHAVDHPRLFDDGDLEDDTMFPESDPVSASLPVGEGDATDAEDSWEIETIDHLEGLRATTGTAIALLGTRDAPTWRHHVDELLQLLTLPDDFEDSDDLAVEVIRLRRATSELQSRLTGLPEEVQTAIVGLLATRAQHLRGRLDVDVGPRLSLDRLQRYRITADLPMVHGLLPTPRPEHGSWEADARRWWALLRPPVDG